MKLKHLLIASICVGASLTAYAEGEWLHVKTGKGWEVFSLENVDRLDFTGNVMNASDKNGVQVASFNRADLQNMYVDNDKESTGAAGIETVVNGNAAKAFSFDSAAKTVVMNDDGEFSIYDIEGKRLLSIPGAKSGETIDLSHVSAGVVILKSNGFTLKALLK